MYKNISNNVLVEISGGVDSALALYLLKKQGYNCIAATMILTNNQNEDDLNSATDICSKLNIPYYRINLIDKFKHNVIDYFINTYNNAQTPNPCVMCNKTMKFGIMQSIAKKYNCKKIATGHYAQIIKNNNYYELHCAKDTSKDQSYFLHFLNQDLLSRLIFPLGRYTKKNIITIAKSKNFKCAKNKESQDICFIKHKNYSSFFNNNNNLSGNIINTKGKILGKHNGLYNYTIGQRKGLGISLGIPYYVIALDKTKNEVILGTKEESCTKNVNVVNFHWIDNKYIKPLIKCKAKLRYRQNPQQCDAFVNMVNPKKISLKFKRNVFAVTPGQFAVLYEETKVLGGGTIIN